MSEEDKIIITVCLVIGFLFALFYYVNKKTYVKIDYKKIENYVKERTEKINQNQIQIEKSVQEKDPNFNKEKFIEFSKEVFIKIQQAWTTRDYSKIRIYETKNLFEQHKNQIQSYIKNNQINVREVIYIENVYLYNYAQEGNKEILTVKLNALMKNYIIDATTKSVFRGDKSTAKSENFSLTFIRQAGEKTKSEVIQINKINCPNCGAEAQITAVGKCEYCGSIIITGKYNWVLSNIEEEKVRM